MTVHPFQEMDTMGAASQAGQWHWTDLHNPTPVSCSNGACTNQLKWRSDGTDFNYANYGSNPTVRCLSYGGFEAFKSWPSVKETCAI